ncbi:DUF3040 domain-containing protein [Amycolatopsis sp. SID8362]|uniref:DUF3040 domain-containing protein n=1 Tax=Amycolatopsis sp. SID8362 TaxID=2690346 RepID=UPI001369A7E6|nr:DUF3040 domain-containing protein [Amycolatopsis sp. SID8362]NBH10361.1 DUF3040 domain-containing protein [Amycolatopsis sp. SID8362]NED47056.1 DUF3040 domain-containing protein [Amycolatopsis sp. SID8362]
MTLHDYEQRQLDEIAHRLAEESPCLAQQLADFKQVPSWLVLMATLSPLTVGVLLTVAGLQLGIPDVAVIGAAVAVSAPTLGWFVWCRGGSSS